MEFVAYATENYKVLADVWLNSVKTIVSDANDIHLRVDSIHGEYDAMNDVYVQSIENKLENLLDFEPTKELVVSSDCDIQFFKDGDWEALFNHIRKSTRQIFFMRDAIREHVNAGFYIVKKEYFNTVYKSFVRRMITHGIREYSLLEQAYINEHRDELDWGFIPDEYIVDKLNDSTYDLDRICIHHAICAGKTLMEKLACMHKVKSMIYSKTPDCMKIHGDYELVVAKYKENISWTKRYANVKVYDKGPRGNTPNIGREVHTYLKYIVDNYEQLPMTVYFSQGRISDHGFDESQFTNPVYSINMIGGSVLIGSDKTYVYPVERVNIVDWFHKYVDPDVDLDLPIKIWWNSIFSISREQIKSRSKEYYNMLLELIPKTKNPGVVYYIEKMWYYIFNMHKRKSMDICSVYCLFHDSEEKKVKEILNVYDWMIPYKLSSTKYFEGEIFLSDDVEIDDTKKYVGQVTCTLFDKTFPNTNIDTILENANADVVTLRHCSDHKLKNVHRLHPNFINIWVRLLKKLLPGDVNLLSNDIPLFYNNYWFTRPKIMKEYRDFFKKAVILLEDDPEVYDDACYIEGKISTEKLIDISARPYYTYHPFILERLPCIFFWYKGYSIHHHKQR
jgi:hypothetical protein